MISAMLGMAMVARGGVDFDWTLTCERTDFRATGRYAEALRFCEQLGLQDNVSVFPIGKSPEGREMVVVVVSTDSDVLNFENRKKPLLFVNNGIHSGEIDGKDATLVLARRLVNPDGAPEEANWSGLLDKASFAFIPVLSVDGHERFSRFNRVNQNGPEEMGWRATSENLNLNRDFAKIDGLEMRNLLEFVNDIEPDFYIDNHVTDGGDWQYVVQWDVPRYPTMAKATVDVSQKFVDEVMPKLTKSGFENAPYFGGFDDRNPGRGITLGFYGPRYSTGYWAMRNRPSMLVETHVLKPYKERYDATLELNRLTLEWVGANASLLRVRNQYGDVEGMAMDEGEDVVLTARNSGKTKPYVFKGLKFDPYKSDVSGAEIPRWTREKVNHETVIRDEFEAGVSVKAPAGWFVPSYLRSVVDRLQVHGVQMIPVRDEAVGTTVRWTVQKFDGVSLGTSTFEGRTMPRFKVIDVERDIVVPAGFVVPVNQRLVRLAAQLLEPTSGDSFAAWGFLNAYLESKEYAEAYAMEPIAQEMLKDPATKAAFEEALKDVSFAGSPGARLNWFYERSPWFDQRYLIHPIYRLTGTEMARLIP
jgi:hypothetical protein